MTTQRYRVLLVDDDRSVRDGLRVILEHEADFIVVGEASAGAQAIGVANRLRPMIAIVDINMPGMDGVETTRALLKTDPALRILILTAFHVGDTIIGALQAGASGFLLKDLRPGQLPQALRRMMRGETVLADQATRTIITRAIAATGDSAPNFEGELAALTDRERELVTAVGYGLTNSEIATRLFISPGSVKVYVSRVLEKLSLSNRTQLAILAHKSGLLAADDSSP